MVRASTGYRWNMTHPNDMHPEDHSPEGGGQDPTGVNRAPARIGALVALIVIGLAAMVIVGVMIL